MLPAMIWCVAILFLFVLVNLSSLKRARQALLEAGRELEEVLPDTGSPAATVDSRARVFMQTALLDAEQLSRLQRLLQTYQQRKRQYNAYVAANPTRLVAKLFGYKAEV